MVGIYKIENQINRKVYIGLSLDISKRWTTHISTAKNKNAKEYHYPLYRAIRKYGVDNFTFAVLEETEKNYLLLEKREKFWIESYDSFNNGYNQINGGNIAKTDKGGENHPNHKLSVTDVENIRKRWSNKIESVSTIYQDYSNVISKSGFKKIYSWQTWKKILPELNTPENRNFHRNNASAYSNLGAKNGRSILTESDIRKIRTAKKDGVSKEKIFSTYEKLGISKRGFDAVWHLETWKHIII